MQSGLPRAIASVCRKHGHGQVSRSYEIAWRYTFTTTHFRSEAISCPHHHQRELALSKEDEAFTLKVSPLSKLPHFLFRGPACSPHHLAKHLAFFKSIGILADGFSKIVSMYPQALMLNPDTDLQLSVSLLESAVGKNLVAECILSWPSLLGLGYPQKELGLGLESSRKIEVDSPRQGPGISSQGLWPSQKELSQEASGLGLVASQERLGLGLGSLDQEPGFKQQGPGPSMQDLGLIQEDFAGKVTFLLKCGFKKNTKLLANALHCALHKSKQDVDGILYAITSFGLSRNHACRLVKLQPTVLQQKPAEVTTKLDFILNTLGFSFEDLLKYSSFMGHSLDSHIRPRYLMYMWLKSKRLLRRNFKLDYIMSMSEKQFLCKFVECHEGGVSTYHRLMGHVK